MKSIQQYYPYYLVAIFAIFLGSQITEGVLLVPYWQSLSAVDFYAYYGEFGHGIGRFYTILTIIAALISVSLVITNFVKKSPALWLSLISSLFAVLFVACFYMYFKGTNELFFEAALNEESLRQELITWSKWHWSRIGLEFLSLVFLIAAFQKNNSSHQKKVIDRPL